MKLEDIKKLVSDAIATISPMLANCINELTQKMIIADGDNVDENGIIIIKDEDHEEITDETYEKLARTENLLFNAFGNIIKAKGELGEQLDVPEMMIKMQYETEMAEAMEMYRDYKNAEDILNDGNEEE